MIERTQLARCFISTIALLLAASPAFATTNYSDVATPSFTYTLIDETSTFGDPEPLFGQPVGVGNNLHFNPANFTASASGFGGFDQTGALLHFDVMANVADTPLTSIEILEFGDNTLLAFPPPGTSATGTFISMAGFVTIIDTVSGNNLGLTIGFPVSQQFTELPTDVGTTLWQLSVFLDISATVADATKIRISLDNDLYAYSDTGTSAKIQKKVSDGVVVIPTPEPTTLMLLGGGVLVTLIGTRRRQGSLS
jgi:hypothetical protein